MITVLKGKRRKKKIREQQIKVAINAAILYASEKRRAHIRREGCHSFSEAGKLLGHYARQCKTLPQTEKDHYIHLWRVRQEEKKLHAKRLDALKAYNYVRRVTFSPNKPKL